MARAGLPARVCWVQAEVLRGSQLRGGGAGWAGRRGGPWAWSITMGFCRSSGLCCALEMSLPPAASCFRPL